MHWSAALITVYRTVFWVCVVLVLSAIICSYFQSLDRVLFHHNSFDYHCDFLRPFFFFFTTSLGFWLGSFGSTNAPMMFLPLDFPFEHSIEHVTLGLLYAMLDSLLGYSTGYLQALQLILHSLVGAVNHPLATCLLYVGPLFGNQVWNDSGFVSLT